jgi:hypothetical protein
MYVPIEDGIGDRTVADYFVSARDGLLGSDFGGLPTMPVHLETDLTDLQHP